MESQTVYHPQFGGGKLLKTYMSGFEWEVQFESGRRFRLPAKEFTQESLAAIQGERIVLPTPQRTASLGTDQFRARQTLEALRVGIVPVQDAETLTIGLEAERVTLNRAFERSSERSGDVLAVIGDYGFGKSHFIELAALRGLRDNFIIASASLDLVEVPPSKAHKIYETLVTSLRYPDTAEAWIVSALEKGCWKTRLSLVNLLVCVRVSQKTVRWLLHCWHCRIVLARLRLKKLCSGLVVKLSHKPR